MKTWRREFAGSIPEIMAAARWVDQIAGEQALPADVAYSLRVCVEELLTNVVRHSGLASPKIDLTLSLPPGRIELVLEDDGKPFDVAAATPSRAGKPLDNVQPGGLGIQLIHSFTDRLDYSRVGARNRVVAEFILPEVKSEA
jgi:serine/threonine-protein kinase RsbW